MRRILAAVDGSETSLRAVDLAAELAARFEAELTLVNVVEGGEPPPWALAEYAQLERIRGSMAQFAEAFARDCIATARARALGHGAVQVRDEVCFGDPVDEILKCREKTGSDAIVVGSRGHGRLSGLLLGSVSQKSVSLAPCTVIVVR